MNEPKPLNNFLLFILVAGLAVGFSFLPKLARYFEAGKSLAALNGIRQEIISKQKGEKFAIDRNNFLEALNKETLGEFDEARELLKTISADFPEYEKVDKEMDKVQTAIEENLRAELSATKVRATTEEEKAQSEFAKRMAEEAARKLAEEHAKTDQLAKTNAEFRAAQIQADENKMNADNDGDGLTYREELAKKTSDDNIDTDGDKINDKEDTNPAGGGRNIAQHFEWKYGGTDYSWNFSVPSDWYDYYKNKTRSEHGAVYVTYDDPVIKAIAENLTLEADKKGFCKACFAAAFIEGLQYVTDNLTGQDEYPKYPVETLVEANGDCEDTSYLAAALIKAMGVDTILVLFSYHMGVGVSGSGLNSGVYYEVNGKKYYYIETTSDGWGIGTFPEQFVSEQATLIDIPSGERQAGYPQR